MGKKNRNKYFGKCRFYGNQKFYSNFPANVYPVAKPEQINIIALQVFGSLHYQVNAQD